jgi:hypothetical protein
MRDNEEHDPLDGWLSQQVRPLPPPPGTFELITKRARRRKIRKLGVTVASAAAVAAAVVAVTVPGGLLRLNPSPTSVNNAAAGRTSSPSGRGTHQQTGTGTPDATPTPARKSPPPTASVSSGPTEPIGPVPDNFQPSSVTFVDPEQAWVIGQAGTPGHCADANPYLCTSIVRTDNTGQSWHGGPAPKTGAAAGATGVSGLRFLDGVNGWAFGPELWVTHDEGNTWNQLSTGGQRVTDLETVGGRAYALWANCSGSSGVSFASDCTSFTLMTTTATSDNWVPVGGATNGLTNGGNPTSAVIGLASNVGYLLAPDGTLYSGPIGGTWVKVGTAPCQPGSGAMANGLPGNSSFAVASPAFLAIACEGTTAPDLRIYTSVNGGAFWTALPSLAASITSDYGAQTSLTATSGGTLVLATTRGIYVRPAGSSQWQSSNATGSGAPTGGFTYVGMTTLTQGVAVPADTSLHEIWMTSDGGKTWAPTTPITPGGATATPSSGSSSPAS